MSKLITLTDASIEEIKAEFARALTTAIPDGKINFQKEFGKIQRRAELCFKETAWLKMQELIKECSKEVGWHGTARRGDDPEKDEYIIDDILVYPQVVTGATVTPDQEQYQMWLMTQEDEIFNNIRMQGHSHVNFGTSPSGVDTTFYDQILQQLDDTMFYIFMIWNKRGEKTIKIYDMAKNVMFDTSDVTVTVMDDEIGIQKFISDAKQMITEEVRPAMTSAAATHSTPVTTGATSNPYGSYGNYGGYNQQPQNSLYSQAYKSNEPSSKPAASTAPLPVVASVKAADTVKKNGAKHRVGDGRKRTKPASSAGSSGSSSSYPKSHMFDDDLDDPYGPYGFRDQYFGYED